MKEVAMEKFAVFTFVLVLPVASVLGKLGAPGGPLKLQQEVVDCMKVWKNFPFAVAISDADNDTVFECMTTRRVKLDLETNTTTYIFDLPSTGEKITFDGWLSERPGTVYFTVDGDPTTWEGTFYYSDYKNCAVTDYEFHGHQCVLWTQPELKDNVPQNCINHFVDACGVVPPPHSRDLCPDNEGDY